MPMELAVDRKYELMLRDPLFNFFIQKERERLKNPHDESLWEEAQELDRQLWEKWRARIHWPESTVQGLTDFWMLVREPHRAVTDAREGGTLIINEQGKIIWASFDENNLIYCPPHKIPLIIDPTILTLHDINVIKEEVAKIVKDEIKKRKKALQKKGDLGSLNLNLKSDGTQAESMTDFPYASTPDEPAELAPLLRCRQETFEKYLRWYDLKMKGLTFRLIALVEFHGKPHAKNEQFEKILARKRKPKVGKPVKGESAVRAGFTLIYRAIHRKIPPNQEDQIPSHDKYICPHHGSECPEDCDYLKQWLTDFDNKHPMKPIKERLFHDQREDLKEGQQRAAQFIGLMKSID